jgi:hypothetical protein
LVLRPLRITAKSGRYSRTSEKDLQQRHRRGGDPCSLAPPEISKMPVATVGRGWLRGAPPDGALYSSAPV